jgi:prolyl-tRNA synthetase
MRQSQLFSKTLKTISAEETAPNAKFLARGGFVFKNSAGVYSYLPLGWRVIQKINAIIREEINAIGGIELFMPALVDRKYLEATDRFRLDVGFDVLAKNEKEAVFSLGWTHEEVLTAVVSKFISSYKDLPVALYQIQTKFRNEARAKSGLLRTREFLMKDLYSFHASEEDLFLYYEKVKQAYLSVFRRCGLDAFYTLAGGGDFTMQNTHEFQVVSEVGEDTIFYCGQCRYAENKEISQLQEGSMCPKCAGQMKQGSAIEVGNIFPLGTKYSSAFNLQFTDEKGVKKLVVMGSYGIGVSRLMATIVEIYHDENGVIWPAHVSPFDIHLVRIASSQDDGVTSRGDKVYDNLLAWGKEVLYDDRIAKLAGEKFADADLIGIPLRIVVSKKTLEKEAVEIKRRGGKTVEFVPIQELKTFLERS